MHSPIDRARRYLATLPPSISGSEGRKALFRAAHALTKGFLLSIDESLPLLREYNAHALPPWQERDLIANLKSAMAKGKAADGYLLTTDRTRTTAARPPARPVTAPPPTAKPTSRRPRRDDRRFRLPTRAEVETIALLRGVDPSTVQMVVNEGLLCVAPHRRIPAWWLVDDNIAQARRLDGSLWQFQDGKKGKTSNDGPVDAFGIGMGMNETTSRVIVTEGLASILESLECMRRIAAASNGKWPEDVGLVAAWGAGANFLERKADADLLSILSRCAVLVVADPGETGEGAAVRWHRQLTEAGCERITMICPVDGDLGDNIRSFPNCPQTIREFLETTSKPTAPEAPGNQQNNDQTNERKASA